MRRRIRTDFFITKLRRFCDLWAFESQISLCVAISYLIGPVTTVSVFVVSQTFWAFEFKSNASSAVLEFTTVGRVSHWIVAELMRTLVGGSGWLQFRTSSAFNVDWILAWISEREVLIVEEETIWTQLFFAYTIGALNISVALSGNGEVAVFFRAILSGCCKTEKED